MSFHFQPQADSSDEEEAVDISAWKSGNSKPAMQQRPPSPPEAALEIMDELADQVNDEDEPEDIGTFQGDLNDAADEVVNEQEAEEVDEAEEEEAVPFASLGFTSVNKPARPQVAITLPESSEDEQPTPSQMRLPTRTRRSTSKPATVNKQATRILVPVIPRLELDSSEADEIIDFTVGNDVVRRVKKELKRRRGENVYVVEFDDRHVEEVSPLSLLIYPGLFHAVLCKRQRFHVLVGALETHHCDWKHALLSCRSSS